MPLRRISYQKWSREFRAAERDRSRSRHPGRVSDNRFLRDIEQAFEEGHIRPRDVELRPLFEYLVPNGHELVRSWAPSEQGDRRIQLHDVFSEAGAVTTAAFANVSGQIVFTTTQEQFNNPVLIGDQVCTVIPTEFDGEKIPGVTNLGDIAEIIGEGKDYPLAGVGETWIETPNTAKRGFIVPLTKEAIFFNRTGQLIEKCSKVAESMAINREKRILDAVLGITTLYRRNGGAAQATYGDTHTNGDFDNLVASNALQDWTDIEAAELAFDAITDPDTGEPIIIGGLEIIVPTALKHTARRILNATEVRTVTNTNTTTNGPNSLEAYNLHSNQYVKARTSSASTWFAGDFKGAFAYMQNWPAQSSQAPVNSHDEFHRDVAQQWKITERGAPAVREPRKVVKCTA